MEFQAKDQPLYWKDTSGCALTERWQNATEISSKNQNSSDR